MSSTPPECTSDGACPGNLLTRHLADMLQYFLPEYFDRFVEFVTIKYPLLLVAIIIYLVVLRWLRNRWRETTQDAAEVARRVFLERVASADGGGGENDGP
jgi:hypothetical protein